MIDGIPARGPSIFTYFWVNYNDLTVLPHWEEWLVRGIIPKFCLTIQVSEIYCNLPRYYIDIVYSDNIPTILYFVPLQMEYFYQKDIIGLVHDLIWRSCDFHAPFGTPMFIGDGRLGPRYLDWWQPSGNQTWQWEWLQF